MIGPRAGSNVLVIPFGLSSRTQKLVLHLAGDHNPGMNSVVDLSSVTAYSGAIERDFFTLDAMLGPELLVDVRLCKIDVEGYEMDVLNGMRRSMAAMQQAAFVVEVSRPYLTLAGARCEDLYDFFQSFGFIPRFGLHDAEQYDEVFERGPSSPEVQGTVSGI